MSVTIQHHYSQIFDSCFFGPFQLDLNKAVKAKANTTNLTADVAIKILKSIQRESEIKSLLTDHVTSLVLGAALFVGAVAISVLVCLLLADFLITDFIAIIILFPTILVMFEGAYMFASSYEALLNGAPSAMSQAYQQQADIAESYISQISRLPPGSVVRVV